MSFRKPDKNNALSEIEAKAEQLANKLADRPYGKEHKEDVLSDKEETVRVQILLPKSMHAALLKRILENKLEGCGEFNLSDVTRTLYTRYLEKRD
ncbi:hypothetical protein FKH18_26120 [Salmonella enterica]|uniref:CopG family transcriptional regulator n=2 Tax=Salmonella enterica TaxID=28901 RepID=A0A5V3YKI4_SALER|nr:hypothetical protein [Salmonella enterica]EBR8575426.1 hypothetical protein [Salmonella enterica subsp. enterica serovar Java]EBW7311996.1 hypothetical protein [Salmonella enterica subsp. enterica serovar Enteritidis]EBW9700617.1 hypothetical protein [Salmonella enterica subsp. enterica serovar Oranienburg]ECC1750842.1 hypothetical protein [Salmonella enterica subsp. diarizonae]EKN5804690.1 hypothetical protein [Salmonella enterica subsp. enterica]